MLHLLNLVALGVGLDFLQNLVHLLELEVDEVVHQTLTLHDMVAKEVEVERGLFGEGFLHIAIKIDGL